MGKIFVGDTSLSEKFSWMEANHENNEIKSTTKIFTYTVCLSIINYSKLKVYATLANSYIVGFY